MNTTRKFAIGLGIAGGALLAAWLLTGDRKRKTKELVLQGAQSLKRNLKRSLKKPVTPEDSDGYYV